MGFYILTILSKEVYEKNWYKTESVIEVLIFKRAKKYMLMLLAAAVIGTAFYTGYIISVALHKNKNPKTSGLSAISRYSTG